MRAAAANRRLSIKLINNFIASMRRTRTRNPSTCSWASEHDAMRVNVEHHTHKHTQADAHTHTVRRTTYVIIFKSACCVRAFRQSGLRWCRLTLALASLRNQPARPYNTFNPLFLAINLVWRTPAETHTHTHMAPFLFLSHMGAWAVWAVSAWAVRANGL